MRSHILILVLLAAFLLIPVIVCAEDATEWTTRGQAALDAKNYPDALTYFNNALALDNNYASALSGKAVALNALGNYTNALDAANQSLAIRSQDQNGLNAKALALFNLQRYGEAVVAYDNLLVVQVNNMDAYCKQGYAYQMINKSDSAVVSYKRCILLDPLNIDAWNNFGLTYMAMGKYTEALSAFDSATSIAVGNATSWNNKGKALVALGRTSDALECFNKAIGIDPNFTDALNNRDSVRGQLQVFNISGTVTPVPTISRIGTFYTTATPVQVQTPVVTTAPSGEITQEIPATTVSIAKKATYSPLSPLTVPYAFVVLAGMAAIMRRMKK